MQLYRTDISGRPFVQSLQTSDISNQGARLTGLTSRLAVGEIVRIRCGDQKAQFRVVWCGQPGGANEGQVGVHARPGSKCIWPVRPPPPAVDLHSPKLADRRRSPRIKDILKMEMQVEGRSARVWTNTTDVNLFGCYVATPDPPKIGTRLHVALWPGDQKVSATAIVRASHPGLGCGIEFCWTSEADRVCWLGYYASLAGSLGPESALAADQK